MLKKEYLTKAIEYIVIAIFFVGISYARFINLETRVDRYEGKTEDITLKVNTLEVKIDYIKDGIIEIKQSLKNR